MVGGSDRMVAWGRGLRPTYRVGGWRATVFVHRRGARAPASATVAAGHLPSEVTSLAVRAVQLPPELAMPPILRRLARYAPLASLVLLSGCLVFACRI